MLCFVLSACRPALPTPVEHKSEPVVDMSSKVQTLHRQIQERDKIIEERDKRIEELESQLDALKLIDQDREKHRKPPRPPTTLEPLQ
jgi:predicted RNase H-like nuclease (RuvC/YqgF family)